ncbi:MAG TPA: formylglycine-generating enzyme family protein [Oligoflexia bacterium]|nr:formylglycine-generating enzyme family protein [Oligoflexia bacterium]
MKLAKRICTISLLLALLTATYSRAEESLPVSDKARTCARFLSKTSFWHLASKVKFGHYRLVREIMESRVLEAPELRKRKEKVGEGHLLLTTPKGGKEFYLVEFTENEALIRTVDGKYYRIQIRDSRMLPAGQDGPYRPLYALGDGSHTFFETTPLSARGIFEAIATKNKIDSQVLAQAKPESFEFVEFGPGKFMMGSPKEETSRHSDERQHEVIITRPFEMAKGPVTQALWYTVKAANPARFKDSGIAVAGDKVDPNKPIENVSWEDAQAFILALNESQSEYTYRLPTEAEWEYAARAGTTTAYSFGNNPKDMGDYAHFSNQRTTDIATRKPNPAGLFDMHGNVWEWVQDWYDSNYHKGNNVDPIGPSSGSRRVLRGGSWYYVARELRSARRYYAHPRVRSGVVGFRLVRTRRGQ